MVGARRIAAYTDAAKEFPVAGSIQGESSAEHIDSTDSSPEHRIVGCSILGRITAVSHVGADRIAFLKAEQRPSGLNCGIKVGSRQRQLRQAECIGSVRLLCGDHAATGPLIAAIGPSESDRTNDAITIHNSSPHVEAKPPVGRWRQRGVPESTY